MADTSDVENALKALVLAAVYPNGSSSPSIVNADLFVERGWPKSAQLDTNLAAGKAHISIFPPEGLERNTTRYPREEFQVAPPVHTLTAAVAGNTIIIGGAVSVPQNVLALCGTQFVAAYAVAANDTLATIATALAALIAARFPGTAAAGAVITVAGKPGILQARIAATASMWTRQKQQEKTYWITCWCPTPAMRDVLAPAIDVALSKIDRITLADQSLARLRYALSRTCDEGQKVQIYRRDVVYTVEYETATVATANETGAIGVTTGPAGAQQTNYF
jgi:hypothetical protein